MSLKRGLLIVFEGCDKTGKSTQCKLLFEELKQKNIEVRMISFPNRTTQTGKIIDQYLKGNIYLSDEDIHILFLKIDGKIIDTIKTNILNGITIIIDRYSYSGIAFSVAKGLDFEWCKQTENGLLKPDIIIYLTGQTKNMASRHGYGSEIYERIEIQDKVKECYEKMIEIPLWNKINADQDILIIKKQIETIFIQKFSLENKKLEYI